ncbi:MAG: hypothetical protein DMG34_07030 [Acidobacteria bacterium]|jgi:hypothetical protein|nr:MAG: hypothetical protein DMG34_07030 [Acidobacteriota bacterium]
MLYLIFGFLEWSESESSEQTHLAPLVVVPVTLDRDIRYRDESRGFVLQETRRNGGHRTWRRDLEPLPRSHNTAA